MSCLKFSTSLSIELVWPVAFLIFSSCSPSRFSKVRRAFSTAIGSQSNLRFRPDSTRKRFPYRQAVEIAGGVKEQGAVFRGSSICLTSTEGMENVLPPSSI
jgi:hypothetical protein